MARAGMRLALAALAATTGAAAPALQSGV